MRVGRFVFSIGHSIWPDLGWHYLDGRRYPRILTRVHDDRVVFGRGGIVAFGGLMVWWTRDAS